MPSVEIVRVSMSLSVQVAEDTLTEQMGELVLALGPNLAEQVNAYVRRERLGYYPALEYFNRQGEAIDADLLSAAEHVAWLVGEFVRRQIKTRLREPFSNVRFEKTQPVSFSLPRVRPSDRNALESLARHYSPYTVRLNMTLSSVERVGGNREGYERLARHKVMRWLEDGFQTVKIHDARLA